MNPYGAPPPGQRQIYWAVGGGKTFNPKMALIPKQLRKDHDPQDGIVHPTPKQQYQQQQQQQQIQQQQQANSDVDGQTAETNLPTLTRDDDDDDGEEDEGLRKRIEALRAK